MRVRLKNFLIPTEPRAAHKVVEPNVSAVVPACKPGATALRLVEDLLAYNPRLFVVVVDDSTPRDYAPSIPVLERLQTLGPRVTLLRTPSAPQIQTPARLPARPNLSRPPGSSAAAALLHTSAIRQQAVPLHAPEPLPKGFINFM